MIDVNSLSLDELFELVQTAGRTIPERQAVEAAPASLLKYAKLMHPNFESPLHLSVLADKLEKVAKGEIRRLCVHMPPRHGKTMLASEFFPAWYLGRYPDRYAVFATYAQELADDVGRKVRNQLLDPKFQQIFPGVTMARDSASIRRFNTNQKGSFFAVGVGGTLTGRGGHLLIVDDPFKGHEDAESAVQRRNVIEWYKSVFSTRQMPGASMIIICTRWHEEDLAGYVLEVAKEPWEVLSLPAIAEKADPLGREEGEPLWPEKFPLKELMLHREEDGIRIFNALYQQRPSSEQGNLFKRDWWREWTMKDEDGKLTSPEIEMIVQAYDTSHGEKEQKEGDFTSISTWGIWRDSDNTPNVMMLHAYKSRKEYPEMKKDAMRLYRQFKPDVAICEYKQSGITLVNDLRRQGIFLTKFSPGTDKLARANAVLVMFEQGRVWYPRRQPWAEDLIDEAAGFPYRKHDDQVDSMVLALAYIKNMLPQRALGYGGDDDDWDEDEVKGRSWLRIAS